MKTLEPFFIIKGQQVSRTKSQENLKTLSHCPSPYQGITHEKSFCVNT